MGAVCVWQLYICLEACFLLLQILLLFVVYGSFPIKPCFAGGHWNHTQSTMEYLS